MIDEAQRLLDVALAVARLGVVLADQPAQRRAHLLVRGGRRNAQRFVQRCLHAIVYGPVTAGAQSGARLQPWVMPRDLSGKNLRPGLTTRPSGNRKLERLAAARTPRRRKRPIRPPLPFAGKTLLPAPYARTPRPVVGTSSSAMPLRLSRAQSRRSRAESPPGRPLVRDSSALAAASSPRRRPAVRELFADPRRLARTFAQVVQLGATHVALALHLDRGEQRRVRLERALDAFAARDLAHGERGIEAAIALGDHHALVRLDALALAFDHVDVDDDRVARRELGNRLAEARNFFLLQSFDDVHAAAPVACAAQAAHAAQGDP